MILVCPPGMVRIQERKRLVKESFLVVSRWCSGASVVWVKGVVWVRKESKIRWSHGCTRSSTCSCFNIVFGALDRKRFLNITGWCTEKEEFGLLVSVLVSWYVMEAIERLRLKEVNRRVECGVKILVHCRRGRERTLGWERFVQSTHVVHGTCSFCN